MLLQIIGSIGILIQQCFHGTQYREGIENGTEGIDLHGEAVALQLPANVLCEAGTQHEYLLVVVQAEWIFRDFNLLSSPL